MQWVRLRSGLILAIGLPLVGMLYFAGGSIMEHYRTWKTAEEMVALVTIAGQSSAVVHEIQKERGASAGLLGAEGAQFGPRLKEQRGLTDEAVGRLRDLVGRLAPALGGAEVRTTLETALRMLEQLPGKRADVDAQKIKLSETLGYYTSINTFLIETIARVARIQFDPTVTRDLIAYVNFLHSKERAGIERALLSNVFGAGNFKGREHLHERLLESILIGENFSLAFSSVAGKRQREFFQKRMADEAFDKAHAVREIGLTGLQQSTLGLDARYWFDIQTRKIEILKEVEDYLHQLLLADILNIGAAAKQGLRVNGALALLLAVGTVALGRRALRRPAT